MRHLLVATLAGLAAACSGDKPPEVDANPAGPRCSMQLYDLCIEEHACTSNTCQNFASAGFQVCSQGCDPQTPCPADVTGAAGTCDSNLCRPAMPNMCHL
jgi:hypothetical protein